MGSRLDGGKSGEIMTEIKRGGPGRGQGRKPLNQDGPSVLVSVRLTPAQRAKNGV
jgi:hypothetical protein